MRQDIKWLEDLDMMRRAQVANVADAPPATKIFLPGGGYVQG